MNTMIEQGIAARPAPRRGPDGVVRTSHWLMAVTFFGAYLSAESEQWKLLHMVCGYTLVGLVTVRLLYGLVGPQAARLSLWGRRLASWPACWRQAREARTVFALPWRQALTLALPTTVVAFVLLAPLVVLSGHATEYEWAGSALTDALGELHEGLGNGALALILGHVGLIVLLSVLRGRNLALPMLTGRSDGR